MELAIANSTLTAPVNWGFPIELQELRTAPGGVVAAKTRALVRTDSNEILATVSTRYKPILYSEVIEQARAFTSAFGAPTERVSLSKNGAVMCAEYTYMDKSFAVAKGEVVGLRVYISNSYNTSSAVTVRIGCLVLSCLNGMVASKNAFSYSWRHSKGTVITFPEPKELLGAYTALSHTIDDYSTTSLSSDQFLPALVEMAPVLGSTSAMNVEEQISKLGAGATVWDFMQASTYEITHRNKSGYFYKLNKLSKVDAIIAKVYNREYGEVDVPRPH